MTCEPILANLLTTDLARNPGPKTVTTVPLNDDRPPVPLLVA